MIKHDHYDLIYGTQTVKEHGKTNPLKRLNEIYKKILRQRRKNKK